MTFYRVNFIVCDVWPSLERRVNVPGGISFHRLNEVIQLVFGFEGFHSYDFNIGDVGERIVDFDKAFNVSPGELNSREIIIDNYFDKYHDIFYTYNFEEDWSVFVSVEECFDGDLDCAEILDFSGEFNIPEDCGGPVLFETIVEKYLEGDDDGGSVAGFGFVVEDDVSSGGDFDSLLDKFYDVGSSEDGLGFVGGDFDNFLEKLFSEDIVEGDVDKWDDRFLSFIFFLHELSKFFESRLDEFIDRVCNKYGIEDFGDVDKETYAVLALEFDEFLNSFIHNYLPVVGFSDFLDDDFVDGKVKDLRKFDLKSTQDELVGLFGG